jgi:hypothetical protein
MKKRLLWITVLALFAILLCGCQKESKENLSETEEKKDNNYIYLYDEKDASPASDFQFKEEKDGGVTVIRYKGKDTKVVIPETYNGKKVTEIGGGAFYRTTAESVVLSRYIKKVGGHAFYESETLKSITFSPNLEIIDYEAFTKCTALKEASLPGSLKEIGYMAFNGCTSLKYIFIPKSITGWEAGCTFYQSGLEKIDLEEGITELGYMAFAATQIKSISIPGSLKTVPDGLCARCEKLEKITIGDGVETIENGAFIKTAITELVIPTSVKKINDSAIYSNEKLEKVTFLGDAPEQFVNDEYNFDTAQGGGNYTVYYQKNAKGFTTPRWNGYPAAPVGSKPQPQVEGDFEYVINEDDTVTIAYYLGTATDVVIPDRIAGKTVTAIGKKAFAYNETVALVKLPDTLTEIGYGAFSLCYDLSTINLPEGLKSIGDYAFNMCSLTAISFPASLTKVGANAFSNCQEITYLRIPATLTEIGEYAFSGIGYTNKGWSKGEFELVLDEGIEVIGKWFFATTMESVVLPSTVKRLEEGAFSGCDYLTSITLNEGLVSIGDLAFEGCSNLTEIVIPSTVTEMSVLSFHQCPRLKAVKFEGNAPASFWKQHPEGDDVRPAYDVYRHQEATGFDSDEFDRFDIQIW